MVDLPVLPELGELGPPVVLLVDDMADDRAMYATFLSHMTTCRIIEAASGREALEILARQVPDLMVLDIALPQVDGLTVYTTFRNLTRDDAKPVVALTALPPESPSVSRLITAGVDAVLFKPCAPETLLEQIRGVLAKSRELRARATGERIRSVDLVRRSQELVERSMAAATRGRELLNRPHFLSILRHAKGYFHEMPGLSLSEAQARRLWDLDAVGCRRVLDALLNEGFLIEFQGLFRRPPTH